MIGVLSILAIATGIITPNSYGREPVSPLLDSLETLSDSFTQNPISSQDCVPRLGRTIEEIKKLNPRQFSKRDVSVNSEEALRFLFTSRIRLHEQLRSLDSSHQLHEDCAVTIRRAFRHIRGIEDFIGTVGYRYAQSKRPRPPISTPRPNGPRAIEIDNTRVKPLPRIELPPAEFPSPSAIEPPPYLPVSALVNPHLTSAPGVRSGDVLLSRGNANTSALIARMGDEDTQFSHMAMVYVDPHTQQAWTVEAHIEFGSIITPLKEWLADGKARTVVFRHADAALAHRSAEHIYHRVKSRFDSGNRVKYDFGFNMRDHEHLFCSEVVREGYEVGSQGTVMVPYFASHLTMKNRDIMDRLGIQETQSFIPADIEIDPRFTLIAEWRNFEKLPTVWKKDAILTSIYGWVETDGYAFDPNAWLEMKGGLALVLRNLGFAKDKLPTYMPQDAVVLNFMLDDVVEKLEVILLEKEKVHRRRTGYGLSYYEYLMELDAIQNSQGESKSGPFRFLHR